MKNIFNVNVLLNVIANHRENHFSERGYAFLQAAVHDSRLFARILKKVLKPAEHFARILLFVDVIKNRVNQPFERIFVFAREDLADFPKQKRAQIVFAGTVERQINAALKIFRSLNYALLKAAA